MTKSYLWAVGLQENGNYKAMPDMPFSQWENPYFTVDHPKQDDTVGNLPAQSENEQEKKFKPDDLLTGERIRTPRGSFLVTNMSRDQMEAVGYGFHHQSDDGKYLIMGNGKIAYAVPTQEEKKDE